MIVMGIDPGYAIVGIGIIEYEKGRTRYIHHCAVTTPAGMNTTERLNIIFRETGRLIDEYKPDAVAIEELFFNTNQKTASGATAGTSQGSSHTTAISAVTAWSSQTGL